MERHQRVTEEFRASEYRSKLLKASKIQNRSFNKTRFYEGDLVYYQEQNKTNWNGPVKVFCHRGRDVWLWVKGDLKKIADCKVHPCQVQQEEAEENKREEDVNDRKVQIESGDDLTHKIKYGIMTRSKTKFKTLPDNIVKEMENDSIRI